MFGAEMNIQIISFYSCWEKKKEKKKNVRTRKAIFLLCFGSQSALFFICQTTHCNNQWDFRILKQ